MSKRADVLNRAYANVAKEVNPTMNFDLVPSCRGIKYYFILLKRKLMRVWC